MILFSFLALFLTSSQLRKKQLLVLHPKEIMGPTKGMKPFSKKRNRNAAGGRKRDSGDEENRAPIQRDQDRSYLRQRCFSRSLPSTSFSFSFLSAAVFVEVNSPRPLNHLTCDESPVRQPSAPTSDNRSTRLRLGSCRRTEVGMN